MLGCLLGAAALLMLASVPLTFLGITAALGGVFDTGTAFDVATSSAGRILALRTGGALATWQILGAVRASGGRGRRAGPILAVALCAVDATASHSAPGLPRAAALVLVAVHEAAMVVWWGGLVGVIALARAGEDGVHLARRFAPVAVAALATLIVSGALLAVEHLEGAGDLVRSRYGVVLLVKLSLMGLAITLGIVARRRLSPGGAWRLEGLAIAAVTVTAAAAGEPCPGAVIRQARGRDHRLQTLSMAATSRSAQERRVGITLGVLVTALAGLILAGWGVGALVVPSLATFDAAAALRLVVGEGAAVHAWTAVTWLGSGVVVVVAGLVVCAVLLRRHAHDLIAMVVAGVLGGATLSRAVKLLVDRPRPGLGRVAASGPSFPSGHATEAAAFYGVLIALAVLLPFRPAWRRAAIGACLAVMVAVAASRTALGVHFVTDVIGGLLLGGTWAAVTATAVRRPAWTRRRSGSPPVGEGGPPARRSQQADSSTEP